MTNSRASKEWDTVITKAADQSKTSDTTLANDDELLVTLGIGIWQFECFIIVDSAATPDFKYTFAFGGTSDANVGFTIATSALVDAVWGTSTVIGSAVWPKAIVAHGYADVSSAGVLSLQWAQNTSNGAPTDVNKGSYLKAKKVA